MRGLATILLRHSCGRARTARGRAWTCADDCEGPSGADRRYRALDGLRLNCRHGRADRLVEEAFQGFAPKRRPHLGSNGEAGRRLAPKAANPSPLAQSAFRRQAPEVRAGCIEVHVRICAGGARQLASLLRPAPSSFGRDTLDASPGHLIPRECGCASSLCCLKTESETPPRPLLVRLPRSVFTSRGNRRNTTSHRGTFFPRDRVPPQSLRRR
jgi:hypothetical protein